MCTTAKDNFQELRIYAVLNLVQPPRLLIKEQGNKDFHCFFAFPLPPQVIVFRLGNLVNYSSKMAIDVFLDGETIPHRVGYLEQNASSVCLEPTWPDAFLARSHIMHEKDQMARLVLSFENGVTNDFHEVSLKLPPPKLDLFEKRQLIVQLSKELTAPFLKENKLPSSEQPAKKIKKLDVAGTLPNRKRKSEDDSNNNLVQTKLTNSYFTNASLKRKEIPVKRVSAPKSESQINNKTKPENWPSARWGHSLCMVNNNKCVIIGGQGERYQMVKDSIYLLNNDSKTWEPHSCESCGADRRMGHTATYDPVRNVIYVYGGSTNKRWFADVHVLDLKTWTWEGVKAVGNAPKRSYHSSVLFKTELLVFGGVCPNPDPQPDGCSNELFIFSTVTNSWYQPIVTGEIPTPRSGHSLLLYDEKKAVIFGGWDAPHCFNDLYLLDLVLMEYTCPEVSGQKPTARSWHSSLLLGGNRLLIHGGFDGASNSVLGDSFIFDIDKLTWLKVETHPEICPRVGHAMLCSKNDSKKDEIMVFGGGDNAGLFFSDLLVFEIIKK